MRNFILVSLLVFLTGCAPYVLLYNKIDQSDKSIIIEGNNNFSKELRTVFVNNGWKVLSNSDDKARYKLIYSYRPFPSIKQDDKYGFEIILFDKYNSKVISEYNSTGGIVGAKTAHEIGEMIFEKCTYEKSSYEMMKKSVNQ